MPILLAFFAVWSWDLGYGGFTEDEAFVTRLATQPVSTILRRLNTDESHPPLYFLSMSGWHALVGRHEGVLRVSSLLVGVTLLSVTYRLGVDLKLGRAGALTAACLLGFSPQVTVHLREIRMYGPMLLTAAGAALVAWRFPRLPHRWATSLAVMASLLALFTHYFNVLFVASLGLWGALAFRGAVRRRWIAAQAVAIGVLALWWPTMGRGFLNPTSLAVGKWWASVMPPWETLKRISEVAVFGYRDYQYRPLAGTAAALLLAAWLAGSLAAPRRARSMLLVMVVAPLAAFALICSLRAVFHPKYMLPWLLFAALAAGSLVARHRWLGAGTSLALLAMMAVPTWRTLRMPYEPVLQIGYDDWQRPTARETVRQLDTMAGPGDVFGLGTPDWADCYYAREYFSRDLGCALLPASPTQTVPELESQITGLLAEHQVLWYLDYYNPAWDPDHAAEAALRASALHLGEEAVLDWRLHLYTSPATVVLQARPIGARFADVVELSGAWLRGGQSLHLVLIWRALADRPAVSAKVSVHLIDGDGRLVAQDDSVPVEWTRPVDTWRQNEQLLDVHTLPWPGGVEPTTGWSLRIGLYDPASLARWPAHDAAGQRLAEDEAVIDLADMSIRPPLASSR